MLTTLLISLLALAPVPVQAPDAAFDLKCLHATKGAGGEFEFTEHCARREAGRLRFNPAVLRHMAFDADGLSAVAVDGWSWVRADGVSAPVITFDNGPDDFVAGLARGRQAGGAMVYYDKRLDVALATPYTWVEPFIEGLAAVCARCRFEPDASGEHFEAVGGQWGAIDRSGKLVLPLRDDAASLRRDLDTARAR
ncbi:hypothetical protein [Achromobacter sp. UMC71]|uniref:hypothetical protein n=1 Tax=Achromobacter sp. UMC71 TaxID=1862320 RepID=UPI00160383F3|nr:hypothetical protein [Achromobacter sp. UMC71]